ncbi:MAG: sensor histidine kinase [Bacteroidetes bacterium]|nr:sensor histidine kinase [Bacteroidota bacterium]
MKIDTLGEKLILYFVLLGIGAILIISTVAFYSNKEALMSRTFDQLTSLRIVKKNQIGQFYFDRIRDLSFMAGYSSKGPLSLQKAIISGRFRFPGQYFSAYYFLGPEGVVTQGCFDTAVSAPPLVSEKVFNKIEDQLRIRPVVVYDEAIDEQSGKPYQLIATRMTDTDKGKKPGQWILLLAVSMDAINAIMLNNDPLSGLGLSGETYLVGQDYLMRSNSRFQPNSILRTAVRTQPVIKAMSGSSGTMTTTDYRNIPVLSAYDTISVSGLTWAILAEIDMKEAMVPIYETRTHILLLSVIMIVIFFGIVLFISRRITKPLIRLRNAVVKVGKGHYDIDLPIETQDEIGALTESFNMMALQIKEKTTELQMERFGRIRSVFDGEEIERQRLSRELHDGIGQSLIAIKLRLENLLYQEGNDIRTSIQELKNYFDQIIDEVRRISNNLMPSVLEVFSIPIAFRNLFSETEEHSGLRIHFEAKGNFDDLDKKLKTYIYRLTQEALNNIVKHAEAREVRVNLTRNTVQLTLVIQDDGKGFLLDKVGKDGGNGIHNMRERASLLQGQIDIRSAPSKGTTITLNVPIIVTYVKDQNFPRG